MKKLKADEKTQLLIILVTTIKQLGGMLNEDKGQQAVTAYCLTTELEKAIRIVKGLPF